MTNPENPWAQQPGASPPPYAGGPQYPQYPQHPGDQQHPGVPRPKPVELSFKLWLANVVLGVIGSIIVFLVLDDVIEAAADEAGVSAAAAKDIARPVVMTGLVVGLLIIGLLAALAFQMRNGKNWARVTLTVLGAIGVILALVNIGDEFAVEGIGPVSGTIGVLRMLLIVGAIGLMYGGEANAYFKANQRR